MASEYGWGKRQILEEVYFDEYIEYALAIKKRLLSHYHMLLSIAQNPHTEEPQKFMDALLLEIEEKSYKLDENATLDKSGFEYLKSVMAGNPRVVIK